jgi:hypothetical protein
VSEQWGMTLCPADAAADDKARQLPRHVLPPLTHLMRQTGKQSYRPQQSISCCSSPASLYAAAAASAAEKHDSVSSCGGDSGPEPSPPPSTATAADARRGTQHSTAQHGAWWVHERTSMPGLRGAMKHLQPKHSQPTSAVIHARPVSAHQHQRSSPVCQLGTLKFGRHRGNQG